jgi:hypothetical protein
MKIRGEYWIRDGHVDFADGDTGDKNHEMIAVDHVCSENLEKVYDYAENLGVGPLPSLASMDEPTEAAQSLLGLVRRKLFEATDPKNNNLPLFKSENEIWAEIGRRCGLDAETLSVMTQSSKSIDPRLYVMRREGWIAVRNNNVELFGYDDKKRKNLISGLEEVLDQEGIEDSDEEIEFNLYDHRTGRSSDHTLADIKETGFRPQSLPSTTYNKPLFVPADKSRLSPKTVDARTRSMVQTSETSFRGWLVENGGLIFRRNWPGLIATGGESQDRLSSAKGRQRTRRSR